jgi:BirA family biotin operon repressor/biotin-[acetyl-CoA-carboxylase] ligase
VVFADQQSAGRGRLGRSWESPSGNLFVSVLLPPLPAEQVTALPLAAGLAVAEALDGLGVTPQLKWPNDVMIGGRKLGGILAEGLSGAAGLEAVVLGIGLNVRVVPPTLPDGVAVTSLWAETGRDEDLVALLASVLACLWAWYDRLAAHGPARVVSAWRTRCLPWWGRVVEARAGDELLRGIALDVDERGALLLAREDGSQVAVLSGEVQELRAR